jgi:hypothetical protein
MSGAQGNHQEIIFPVSLIDVVCEIPVKRHVLGLSKTSVQIYCFF